MGAFNNALHPDDHVFMRRLLCELREAVLEQVGKDQTDRLPACRSF